MDQMVPDEASDTRGVIIALIPDLFFSVTVRNTIRRLGFESRIVRTADELTGAVGHATPVLVIGDLGAVRSELDWESIEILVGDGVPMLMFGPHKDVDGLRRAKAAGVTRVVSNGRFHREMPDIIERYAVPSVTGTEADDAADEDMTSGSVPSGTQVEHVAAEESHTIRS